MGIITFPLIIINTLLVIGLAGLWLFKPSGEENFINKIDTKKIVFTKKPGLLTPDDRFFQLEALNKATNQKIELLAGRTQNIERTVKALITKNQN